MPDATFHVKRIPQPHTVRSLMGDKVTGLKCPDCEREWRGKSTARYELHWRVVHGSAS